MNDVIIVSVAWIIIGALWTYYLDKKAYNEGLADAILMHYTGKLTYKSFKDANGQLKIQIRVKESTK